MRGVRAVVLLTLQRQQLGVKQTGGGGEGSNTEEIEDETEELGGSIELQSIESKNAEDNLNEEKKSTCSEIAMHVESNNDNSSSSTTAKLEKLVMETKSQNGMCGELLKLTQPALAKSKLGESLYVGDAKLTNGKLKGKWVSRFVFVTQTRILYYKSSDEYFAQKPAKKVRHVVTIFFITKISFRCSQDLHFFFVL